MSKKYTLVGKPLKLPVEKRIPLTFTLKQHGLTSGTNYSTLMLKKKGNPDFSGLYYRQNSLDDSDWKPYTNFNGDNRRNNKIFRSVK